LCPGFEPDIRPLFRDKDRTPPLKVLDLCWHGEVRAHQGVAASTVSRLGVSAMSSRLPAV
jgi:hypothetical protein